MPVTPGLANAEAEGDVKVEGVRDMEQKAKALLGHGR